MKKGLVMEGGAMRGMFTAGVIDVFMEENIEFDGAIGVSAGATFGCNIKSKQIGRAFNYNCRYCNDYRYGSIKSWLKTGDIFDVDFCYKEIPEKLDIFDTKTFTDNPMEFYVTATDVETGEPVYHRCTDGKGEDLDWIRASASLPVVSKIVNIGDRKLLDGGVADSIPVKYFMSIGYDKNVVILTRSGKYVKGKDRLAPLCRLIYRKYPELVKSICNRPENYNACVEEIKKLEREGKLFVIRPEEELGIKRCEKDTNELKRVYELGRKTARDNLDGLKRYLAET